MGSQPLNFDCQSRCWILYWKAVRADGSFRNSVGEAKQPIISASVTILWEDIAGPTSIRFLPAGERALVPQISSAARTSQKQTPAPLSMLRINCIFGNGFDQMAVRMLWYARRTYWANRWRKNILLCCWESAQGSGWNLPPHELCILVRCASNIWIVSSKALILHRNWIRKTNQLLVPGTQFTTTFLTQKQDRN